MIRYLYPCMVYSLGRDAVAMRHERDEVGRRQDRPQFVRTLIFALVAEILTARARPRLSSLHFHSCTTDVAQTYETRAVL